jgi:hypothetical protein
LKRFYEKSRIGLPQPKSVQTEEMRQDIKRKESEMITENNTSRFFLHYVEYMDLQKAARNRRKGK